MSPRRLPRLRNAGRMRGSNRRSNSLLAMLRVALSSRRFIWIGWMGAAALALLLALGLSFTAQSDDHQVASAAPPQRAWVGRASAPALPAVIHFFDLKRNTAYSVWLRDTDEGKAGTFVFTLRDHTQLSGLAPITQAADATFLQTTQQFAARAAVGCNGRATTESGDQPANVFVRARIDKSGLVAYAQVAYASCSDKLSGEGVMESGCTPTACTDMLAQVGPAVQQYDASMVAASAERSQDAWNTVYVQVSQTTRAQYTAEQFATQLNHQIDSIGQITAVSPITEPPVVQYDTAGQAFFAVKQLITYSRNGTTTTRDSTSYYLIEGGQWVFWFSA